METYRVWSDIELSGFSFFFTGKEKKNKNGDHSSVILPFFLLVLASLVMWFGSWKLGNISPIFILTVERKKILDIGQIIQLHFYRTCELELISSPKSFYFFQYLALI